MRWITYFFFLNKTNKSKETFIERDFGFVLISWNGKIFVFSFFFYKLKLILKEDINITIFIML